MKRVLSIALMLLSGLGATSVFAQSSLLATLNHEESITSYYGASALIEAYEAASDGDVITLSGGTFAAVDIAKAITIRGAGMSSNAETGSLPTIVSGAFVLADPEGKGDDNLTIEGVYFNAKISVNTGSLTNATFLKCRIHSFSNSGWNAPVTDLNIINCKVAKSFYASNSTVHFVNSIVVFDNMSTTGCDFTNCDIIQTTHIQNSTLTNCVIYYTNSGNSGGSTNTSYNNVAFSADGGDPFYGIQNQTNTLIKATEGGDTVDQLFKTFTGTFLDDETFELTDEAAAQYVGTDGTQVGIYGGSLPFDPTPSNPQITKCNVASKSNANGTLSIDIEVKAQ